MTRFFLKKLIRKAAALDLFGSTEPPAAALRAKSGRRVLEPQVVRRSSRRIAPLILKRLGEQPLEPCTGSACLRLVLASKKKNLSWRLPAVSPA